MTLLSAIMFAAAMSANALQEECDETLAGTHGSEYRGCQSKTPTDRTCQKWTSQSPHGHSRTPDNYAGKGLGDHNYCRNPDGHSSIWCYTMDANKRWEDCEPIVTTPAPTTAAPTPVPTTHQDYVGSDKCTEGKTCSDGSAYLAYYENLDSQDCSAKCADGQHGFKGMNVGNCTHFSFTDSGICILYKQCTRGVQQVAVLDQVFPDVSSFTTCDVPYKPPVLEDWVLISKQDVRQQKFPRGARDTYKFNENDPDANAFMNVGLLEKDDWKVDGKYYLKLVYFNDAEDEASADVLEWTQTNWLTDEYVSGETKISPDNLYQHKGCGTFKGLAKSGDGNAVLDGNGRSSCWWNCVGGVGSHGGGLPAWGTKIKKQYRLYIYGNARHIAS